MKFKTDDENRAEPRTFSVLRRRRATRWRGFCKTRHSKIVENITMEVGTKRKLLNLSRKISVESDSRKQKLQQLNFMTSRLRLRLTRSTSHSNNYKEGCV